MLKLARRKTRLRKERRVEAKNLIYAIRRRRRPGVPRGDTSRPSRDQTCRTTKSRDELPRAMISPNYRVPMRSSNANVLWYCLLLTNYSI